LQPETIPSCYRRSRHTEFQPRSGRHAFADRTTKEKLSLLNDALDHMSQGLAMFGKDDRLVLWNRRYVEMYSLQGRMRLGLTLEELMQHRLEVGALDEDPIVYARRAQAAALSGKTVKPAFPG